jgi:hypothetical protein
LLRSPKKPAAAPPSSGGGGDDDDIWAADDVASAPPAAAGPAGLGPGDGAAGRARPRHEVLHRQTVGAEAVYFGMGDSDPGSASCGEFLVRVALPGEKLAGIDLEVRPEGMLVRSKKLSVEKTKTRYCE